MVFQLSPSSHERRHLLLAAAAFIAQAAVGIGHEIAFAVQALNLSVSAVHNRAKRVLNSPLLSLPGPVSLV